MFGVQPQMAINITEKLLQENTQAICTACGYRVHGSPLLKGGIDFDCCDSKLIIYLRQEGNQVILFQGKSFMEGTAP